MKLITRATAHNMKDVGTHFLQQYTNRQDSRTFAEWIGEEYQLLKFRENSKVQQLSNRIDTIQDMLSHGMVVNKAEGIILGSDGQKHDVNDLRDEKYELLTKVDDANDNSFVQQMGMYMCAKQKLESRSLLSKIFHPIRTYHEWNILSDLKNSIRADFNIGDTTFDRFVALAEDHPDLADVGAITYNGTIVRENVMFQPSERQTIDEYIANEKQIDDAESKKKSDIDKDVPDFNEQDILDVHDDESELTGNELDNGTITNDEFLKGIEKDLNDLDEKKLSPIVSNSKKDLDDPSIIIS